MRSLIVALVYAICIGSASAIDASGRMMVYSMGTNSCGRFIEDRRANRDGNYRMWLGGYLTAYNTILPETYDILGSSDLSGALGWIENYCRENPTDTLNRAAASLIEHLLPRRATSRPPT